MEGILRPRAAEPHHPVRVNVSAQAVQAAPAAATCRASVPQQPPSTQTFGRCASSTACSALERGGIARVELRRLVELRVALARRVHAQPADPVREIAQVLEDVREVRRVRAVDHVVGGAGVRGGLDGGDRLAQRPAVRQPPVGLDREGDRAGQPGRGGGAGDPDGLLGVGHRHRGEHVGAGRGERARLQRVVGLGLVGAHLLARDVAVAARADHAVDDDRGGGVARRARQLPDEVDGVAVHALELLALVAELRAPVAVRPPGRGVEHEARVLLRGQREERLEVVAQRRAAVGRVEQRERGEQRQVDAAGEDQVGLEPAVREEEAVARGLGQGVVHVPVTAVAPSIFPLAAARVERPD